MKKIKILVFLLLYTFGYSQEQSISSTMELLNGGFIVANVSDTNFSYSDIDGSPYLNDEFKLATIADNYEKIYARYDSFRNVVQYKSMDEIRVVPQETQFSRISFTPSGETIVLKNLNNKEAGYLFVLEEGEVSLFKEIKTVFNNFIKAKSSYDSDKPANFKTLAPVYYMEIGSSIIKQPRNQKEISKLIPNKKSEIAAFFKENNIKLDKEADLIKLTKFLNKK